MRIGVNTLMNLLVFSSETCRTDIMEELQGLTTDQIKALIEMVKKNKS